MIDKLQHYFGIALRQDIVNIEAMNSAITASLYHVCDYQDGEGLPRRERSSGIFPNRHP